MAKRGNSDFIDIRALLRQYRKYWYWFLASVIICGGIGLAFAKLSPEKYEIKANLLISPEREGLDEAMGGMGAFSSLIGNKGNVQDEIFIVSSHSLYRDVVKALGLNISYTTRKNIFNTETTYPDHPLELIPASGVIDTLKTSINFKVTVNKDGATDITAKIRRKTVAKAKNVTLPYSMKTPLGLFTIAKTKTFPEGKKYTGSINVSSYDAAAENLDANVVCEIINKQTHVISLDMISTNPEYAKAILNGIIARYNERGIADKNEQNQKTADFIDSRIDMLAKELSASEDEVQTYKEQHGLLDVGSDAAYNFTKKGKLEASLLELRTRREVLKMTFDFLSDPRNSYELIPMVLDSQGVEDAIMKYNEMMLNRNTVARSARPDNKTLQQLNDEVAKMRGSITQSVHQALESVEVSIRDQEREMSRALANLSGTPAREREFANLYRDLNIKQGIFVFMLQRREETAMMLATNIAKGITVDEAYTLYEPVGIGRKAIMLIAIFLGLIIPPVVLYIRKVIHNRFETRADIERVTDAPVLGEMAIDRSGNNLIVASDGTSSASEMFRLLRSNLLFMLNDPNDKVVLVTSSVAGEGKSFIAANLAGSLAMTRRRVLLVGMDIRKPRLAEYLGISPKFGLTQYLSSSEIQIPQIITPIKEIPGLDVICAGPVPPNPAELLISDKVDTLFASLRTEYDYIIIDSAPVGLVSDTFSLNRVSDATIFVCRANYTSMSDIETLDEIYSKHRLKKISVVVNGTASRKTYGYGYSEGRHSKS